MFSGLTGSEADKKPCSEQQAQSAHAGGPAPGFRRQQKRGQALCASCHPATGPALPALVCGTRPASISQHGPLPCWLLGLLGTVEPCSKLGSGTCSPWQPSSPERGGGGGVQNQNADAEQIIVARALTLCLSDSGLLPTRISFWVSLSILDKRELICP